MFVSLVKNLFVLFVFFLMISNNFAQSDSTSTESVKILLENGGTILGKLIEKDSLQYRILDENQIEMIIPADKIERVEFITGREKFNNVNDSRLLFSPTARMPDAGSVYLSVAELFFPFLSVSPLDFATIGGGISIIPGVEHQFYYFAPKVGVSFDDLNFAAGALVLNTLNSPSNEDNVGIYYGAATLDLPRAGITLGLGYGYHGEDVARDPAIMVGFEIQLTGGSYLISENWLLNNSKFQFITLGVRVFGTHFCGDFALGMPLQTGSRGFPILPWVGVGYNF